MTDDGAITGYEVISGDGVYINYKDGDETVKKKLGKSEIYFSKLRFSGRNNDGSDLTIDNLDDYTTLTIENIKHDYGGGKKITIYGRTDSTSQVIHTENESGENNVSIDITPYTKIFIDFNGWSGNDTASQTTLTNLRIF